MSFENPHDDLDPTNDIKQKNADNPPGRNLDQKDPEKNKSDEKSTEKSPGNQKETDKKEDIFTMLAQGKENTDRYVESHPDAKPAVEDPEKAARVEGDMIREWP